MKTILVTGGSGFIGSNFVFRRCLAGDGVINLDKLTYSGNMHNFAELPEDCCHIFVQGDICNSELTAHLLEMYQPDIVVNFAAESHVDRSIVDPDAFVRTNVLGTCSLLRNVKDWWLTLGEPMKTKFRFLHVSTDEVFGSLNADDPAFNENSPYHPNSPYSASKAASDHLVRAFYQTYGGPVMITNCSNNYGPRQFPEKLIPLMILNALEGKPLPVYGNGENVRDWIHVDDHCAALDAVLANGKLGETYTIGGHSERSNIDVVRGVCAALDELSPDANGSYERLIEFVEDRPGHDFRYAVDTTRISNELGWKPEHTFEKGLKETVRWYLEHAEWVEKIRTGTYRKWEKVLQDTRAND